MPIAALQVNRDDVLKRYAELHCLYKDTNKLAVLRQAESHLMENEYEKANVLLEALPSKEQLLDKLYENLKNKPVHKTLKKLLEGKCDNIYQGMKGLFSLGTHICIELEKGNMEYRPLLDETLGAIYKNLK